MKPIDSFFASNCKNIKKTVRFNALFAKNHLQYKKTLLNCIQVYDK